jgi:hypothetical protein
VQRLKPTNARNTQVDDNRIPGTPHFAGVNIRRDRVLRRLQSLEVVQARLATGSVILSETRSDSNQRSLRHGPVPISAEGFRHHSHNSQQNALEEHEMNSDDDSSGCEPSPDQHNAALIIARFFRSACRLDNAADRARELLRRRWREQHPGNYRSPLFELTNSEQLRVLQLYNPHLYGSQHPASPLASNSTSIRLTRVPHMEQHKRFWQLQILARMDQETALLKDTCRQKTQAPISSTTTLHEAYHRQPPSSRERPKTVFDRERTQQTHDLVAFLKSPPNFRYKFTPQSRVRLARSLKNVPSLQPLSSPTGNWN